MGNRWTLLWGGVIVMLGMACGSSDSEVAGTGGSNGGSGGAVAGSGGSSTGGATGTGGAATGGGSGTGGAATDDGGNGSCPPQTSFTLAVHEILDVTWPATTAAAAGSGKVHIWNRTKLAATGMDLSGTTEACGSVLPEFKLSLGGQIVTGKTNGKVLPQFPDAVWDATSMPKFASHGTISGWEAGSTINFDATLGLVGLTMADPKGAWPDSYKDVTAADHDGDGEPAITAIPKNDGDYTQPPSALGIFGSAPTVDKLYIASRTVIALTGTFASCTEQSGMAQVESFDSHVVGCHVNGGNDCVADQIDFVDTGRTKYQVTGATFASKKVADDASCAEIRAALPM
jgi:hypothetical protein